MDTRLVLTVIAPDRPGLVGALSDAIAAGGGNWLDARMATLARHFAGILLVAVPTGRADALVATLRALPGLQVVVGADDTREAAAAPVAPGTSTLLLELTALDRPGIVRDISRVLGERRVSIVELETEHRNGSFSGEDMFLATARLQLPPGLAPDDLRTALEALATELIVDLNVRDAAA